MNAQTNETKHTGRLSFDGWGINGPDKYRTRLATFSDVQTAAEWGDLFAAAPELLAALEAITETCYRLAMQSPTLHPEVDTVIPAARSAIAKAKGGV